MGISVSLQASKELGSHNDRYQNCHREIRLAESPKLLAGYSQIKGWNLVWAVFYTIPTEDAVLVVMKYKRRFKNRTTCLMIFPDITAVLHAIIIAYILIGA
jgi:hypothetical protein